MKGMSNNQIILSEAEKLAPATLHTIATAHHTAAQIEALAAQITVTEDDGTQHPGTTHDAEIILAASELHTFDYWKKEGKSVKLHEKALIECYLWKYTTKPSKAQREAAEAEGKEAAPDPHYYPTKSHLFSCLQVQDSKPAPAGRFSSTAEIIAYNKKLAAERKAAAKAAAEQADTKNALDVLKQTECKAKAAFLAVPETDRKAQAEALSAWRKARQNIAAAEKPAELTTKPAPEIIPAGVTDKKPAAGRSAAFTLSAPLRRIPPTTQRSGTATPTAFSIITRSTLARPRSGTPFTPPTVSASAPAKTAGTPQKPQRLNFSNPSQRWRKPPANA